MRYTFNIAEDKVICVAHFAKKPVRGIAKCNRAEGDLFLEDVGKDLAKARCDKKVAEKRCVRAQKQYAYALAQLQKAYAQMEEVSEYLDASIAGLNGASLVLEAVEAKYR